MNANIDVGENVINLTEKLASQIGTTVENVFPWYINQQIIEGYTLFAIVSLLLAFGLFIIIKTYNKVDFISEETNTYTILFVIGCLIVGFSVVGGIAESQEALSQIINPKYHAIQEITSDMSKLIKK